MTVFERILSLVYTDCPRVPGLLPVDRGRLPDSSSVRPFPRPSSSRSARGGLARCGIGVASARSLGCCAARRPFARPGRGELSPSSQPTVDSTDHRGVQMGALYWSCGGAQKCSKNSHFSFLAWCPACATAFAPMDFINDRARCFCYRIRGIRTSSDRKASRFRTR